jgi:hypothetical protein
MPSAIKFDPLLQIGLFRRRAIRAIHRLGKREHPHRRAPVLLVTGKTAKLSSGMTGGNFETARHRQLLNAQTPNLSSCSRDGGRVRFATMGQILWPMVSLLQPASASTTPFGTSSAIAYPI